MVRYVIIGSLVTLGLVVALGGNSRGNVCEVQSQMQSAVRSFGPVAGMRATSVDAWRAQDILATTSCASVVIRYEDGSTVLQTR